MGATTSSDTVAGQTASATPPPLPRWELVCIIAGLMALNALAIDIMLPALSAMDEAFQLTDDNQRQQVIVLYVMGLGLSQLFYGPLTDRYGRKPVLGIALVIYISAGILCSVTPAFESLLAARFIQGASAGATRVVAAAVVRDFYSGRRMAEFMSLVMMIFMIAPILAPSIGQGVLMVFGEWRSTFWALVVFAVVFGTWAMVRLPETLKPENRRPLNPQGVFDTYKFVFTNRQAVGYMAASSLVFASLFSYISSAEQIYIDVYKVGDTFPLWFAGVAACMAVSNLTNSRIVNRFGMRKLSHTALIIMVALNLLHAGMALAGLETFVSFYVLMMASFLMMGFVGPNFSATAMEPLGRLAGTASALYGFGTTFGSGSVGGYIASTFNGSTTPVFVGNAVSVCCALLIVLYTERGRLFKSGGTV